MPCCCLVVFLFQSFVFTASTKIANITLILFMASSQASQDQPTFPLFTKLPPEIRRLIWLHCLPRRVITFDNSIDHDDQYANLSVPIEYSTNGRRPKISQVCREAAQVVQETGCKLRLEFLRDDSDSIYSWFQPGFDYAAHMNFSCSDQEIADYEGGNWVEDDLRPAEYPADGQLDRAIAGAEKYKLWPSLRAKLIVDFDLRRDDGDDDYNMEIPTELPHPELPRSLDDIAFYAFYNDHFYGGHELNISLCHIRLCLPRKKILSSGLFGLMGDAPLQMIDFHDVSRLRAYACLLDDREGPDNINILKKPIAWLSASWAFARILAPGFSTQVQEWKDYAEWAMMVYAWINMVTDVKRLIEEHQQYTVASSETIYKVWYKESEPEFETTLANLNFAWSPPYQPSLKSFTKQTHRLNETHPWVIKARKYIFQLRPRIMVQATYYDPELKTESKLQRDAY